MTWDRTGDLLHQPQQIYHCKVSPFDGPRTTWGVTANQINTWGLRREATSDRKQYAISQTEELRAKRKTWLAIHARQMIHSNSVGMLEKHY